MTKNHIFIELVEYYDIKESELYNNAYGVPTSAYAVIDVNGRFLLGYNTWRDQWEFPAGKIDSGENAIDAARRELLEETHQDVEDLTFCGMFKIYDSKSKEYRFRAVYYGKIDEIEPFVTEEEDEMAQICLWEFGRNNIYVDEVDCKMIEMSVINNDKLARHS